MKSSDRTGPPAGRGSAADYREHLARALQSRLFAALPRILSQLDRDADSPTFGSFDRNYWHYKIRDFSSAIVQQGMLILDALERWDSPANPLRGNPRLREWTDGALRFWASQQLRSGSFNEYYPFEEGFPPTAFSLQAAGAICRARGFAEPEPAVRRAIQKACDWLLDHPESQVLNQESAALAGLTLAARVPNVRVDERRLESRLSAFLDSQSPEGWFPEYDGPDLGYLSVTVNSLWDIHEATGEERFLQAASRAVRFIAAMISVSGETATMINSRNTDYVLPYGLVRAAATDPLAAGVVGALYANADQADHFLCRTDDRYCCHYVYPYCFRALPHLGEMTAKPAPLPCQEGAEELFAQAGILASHRAGRRSVFVTARKGGVVYVFGPEGLRKADYGWRCSLANGKVAVTQWQDPSYRVEYRQLPEGGEIVVRGSMTAHAYFTPSPVRNMGLRLLSFLLGGKLIPWLKRVMILRRPTVGVDFERRVLIADDRVRIEDAFSGPRLPTVKLRRAPKYSLRHVPSATQFTPEELRPIPEAGRAGAPSGERIVFIRELGLDG